MSLSRSILSLAVNLALSALVPTGETPTLEQRLERLAETLEAARVEAHVPGMSIAIVKDDEIIWTRGFGLADVAAGKPADAGTIYAIGSTTKAFTSTLVGMLVDEGKASWDDPVTDFLPYFDLQIRSDDERAECTLRDLLSHRHGFARMTILWFGGNTTREDILHTAVGAEPWDDFRAGFHYCNVTYLAAGVAAGAADESTWDDLMFDRILEPLEMNSTTLTISNAKKDPRLALGYKWDAAAERAEHRKMVSIDNIGPAGSVNSNAIDMAQWLRLQLGKGSVEDMQLVSTERILETWSPQIQIGGGTSYGLGWMLREHKGRKVVEHGGNIDGFTAQVSLMPSKNLGYVLLMNLDVSPLAQASIPLVFDALLDALPEVKAVASAGEVNLGELDFEEFIGTYIANFATFRDAEFEILVNGERLALHIPDQATTDLERPDAEGRWVSIRDSRVAVSFDRDAEGAVQAMVIHQGEYHFEIPRKGTVLASDVPLSQLGKYVGTFVRAEGGKRVKLSIVRGRLVMEDKGKLLAFNTPDAEGHASLSSRGDFGATFHTNEDGHVDSFVFRGSAGDKLFTRLGDSPDNDLPSVAEVLALRQTDARIVAMQAAGGNKVTGEVWIAQAGVRGSVTIYTQGSDRYANHMDFGKFGSMDVVVRGDEAWTYNSMRGLDVLTGDELAQAILGHPGAVEGDWNDYFDSVEVIRTDTWNERPVYVLRLKNGELPSREYWVDTEYGDVLRINQVTIEGSIRIPVTTTYSDFRALDGIRRAHRVEIENPASGRTVLTLGQHESGLVLDDSIFTLEEPSSDAPAGK